MDWGKILAENGFTVLAAIALAYWVVYLTKVHRAETKEMIVNHRTEIKEIITSYRSDQKEERKAFEQKLDKVMADHIIERTEARQQWQYSINEIKTSMTELTEQVRSINIIKS